MISPTTTTATLWGVWFIGWILSAGITRKTVREQSGSSRLAYSVFTWSGAILLFFHPASLGTLTHSLLTGKVWTSWMGVVLVAVVGTALTQITVAAVIGMLLLITGLIVKIGQEERLLTEHFGATYDAYRTDVRGLIRYV